MRYKHISWSAVLRFKNDMNVTSPEAMALLAEAHQSRSMGTGTVNAAPETQFEDARSKNINPRECAVEVMALRINACESGSQKTFLYEKSCGYFSCGHFYRRRALLWQLALVLPDTQIAWCFVGDGTTVLP